VRNIPLGVAMGNLWWYVIPMSETQTLTETRRAEMVAAAQLRALEAIAEVRANRTEAGERIMALAQQVASDRLARTHVLGANKKGRLLTECVGEATTAELEWDSLSGL